jgi:hypothetical protein
MKKKHQRDVDKMLRKLSGRERRRLLPELAEYAASQTSDGRGHVYGADGLTIFIVSLDGKPRKKARKRSP